MRLLPLALLALLAAGCDALGGTDDAIGLMDDLDGTWSIGVTNELIRTDGTVQPIAPIPNDVYSDPPPLFEVSRTQTQCGSLDSNVSDSDRIARAYGDGGASLCDVLTADGDAKRIIFIGRGAASTDVVGTIREASAGRHVWDFYRPLGDGTTRRFRWTLTPASS